MPTSWKKSNVGSSQSSEEPKGSNRRHAPVPEQQDGKLHFVGFEPEAPRRSLDSLVLSDDQAQQISTTLSLIRNHQKLFVEWNLRAIEPYRQGIAVNLFGPSGTGKSHCAEAIACDLETDIITVNYAEVVSKYVGDTQKNIVTAFRSAATANAVLFFDEADAMLRRRSSMSNQGSDESANLSRSVLLRELDRCSEVVIFATNRAEDYDQAFVRRMLSHVEFGLPDEGAREKIWRRLLIPELPICANVDVADLSRRSEGLSGGDIVNAIISAAAYAVSIDGAVIENEHLIGSIGKVRRDALRVGSGTVRIPRTTAETVPSDEAPHDVRMKLQSILPINATTAESQSG